MRTQILLSLLLLPLVGLTEDFTAFNGTWKQDLSKGFQKLEGTVKYDRTADGRLKITQTDGKEFIYEVDGSPHPDPSRQASSPGSMVTTTVNGDSEFTAVVEKDGQFQFSSTRQVSADGKTLTARYKSRNVDGNVVGGTMLAKRVGEGSGFWGTWKQVSMQSDTPTTLQLKVSKDGSTVISQGGSQKFEWEGRIDGKDYPAKGSNDATMAYKSLRQDVFFNTRLRAAASSLSSARGPYHRTTVP